MASLDDPCLFLGYFAPGRALMAERPWKEVLKADPRAAVQAQVRDVGEDDKGVSTWRVVKREHMRFESVHRR